MTQNQGNLYAVLAIVLWSLFASLVSFCTTIPTLLLMACIYFCCFFILALKMYRKKTNPFSYIKRHPWVVLYIMVSFLSYALPYLYALRLVPEIEASLINYLWPMLTVFLSALLPDQTLKKEHIIGVILGFIGVTALVLNGRSLEFDLSLGHGLALFAAFAWAIYSVGCRLLKKIPSDVMAVALLFNSFILLGAHLMIEDPWVMNANDIIFASIAGITSGIAYYAWDVGIKNGHMQIIGTASNLTPVLSTFFLIVLGVSAYSHSIILAAFLILIGTLYTSKDTLITLYRAYKINVK